MISEEFEAEVSAIRAARQEAALNDRGLVILGCLAFWAVVLILVFGR